MRGSSASAALARWISQQGLANVEVARALGISKSMVTAWRSGALVPGALLRLKIERWTDGAIRARDWLTPEERAALRRLRPYRPPSSGEVAA